MRRNGRRHVDDYLENEELNETYEEYEDFDVEAEADAEDDVYADTEEAPQGRNIWVKIGKIALVILVLIALFFISMKVTEIFLDRNQEPEYSSDAPAYSDSDFTDDEDIPAIEEESEDEVKEEEETEFKEYEEKDTTPVKKPEETKKTEDDKMSDDKPEETKKPEEDKKPEQAPSTTPTPSAPSKPLITPGNPAA